MLTMDRSAVEILTIDDTWTDDWQDAFQLPEPTPEELAAYDAWNRVQMAGEAELFRLIADALAD